MARTQRSTTPVLIIDDDAVHASAMHRALSADPYLCVNIWPSGRGDDELARVCAQTQVAIVAFPSHAETLTLVAQTGSVATIALLEQEDGYTDEAIEAGATACVLRHSGYLNQLPAIVESVVAQRRRLTEMAAGQRKLAATLGRLERDHSALAGLVAQLRNQAMTDPMTGLANRRAFDGQLESLFAAAQRYGTKLSLLMMDIDGLKATNDALGHAAGDRLIAATARVIQDTCRGSDVGARLGGDEFAVILPHTDAAGAELIAQRLAEAYQDVTMPIREALEQESGLRLVGGDVDNSGDQRLTHPVGISIGCATCAQGGVRDAATLIERADASLYDVKQRRNADGARMRAA